MLFASWESAHFNEGRGGRYLSRNRERVRYEVEEAGRGSEEVVRRCEEV
jgi:hypothetical protein